MNPAIKSANIQAAHNLQDLLEVAQSESDRLHMEEIEKSMATHRENTMNLGLFVANPLA